MTARRSCSLIAGVLLLVVLTACSSAKPTASAGPHAAAATPAATSNPATSTPAVAAPRPAATALTGRYVALGDSYTATPLSPRLTGAADRACQRSTRDYPYLVAAALGAAVKLTNVSCFGATTRDLSQPQHTSGPANPAQLDALSAADRLVTVQIGGDDIGFSGIATTCGGLSLTNLNGDPCRQHYTKGGPDQLAQAVTQAAPQVAAALAGIRQRAPHARLLVVGYPDILPVQGNGCWPEVTVARGDLPYLRGVETGLNAMLKAQARRAGATFVDTYTPSIGHDACQRSGTKWVEGLIPTSAALPLHPNALGEQAMAREIEAALR
ncbi:MAG TPA: SGNH/GDSL hydrolase family protein [Streptosporangiaceae bacterium]